MPPSLDQILGQDPALQTLSRAHAAGHTHHAWIFHGPHGVGKHTTALAFAKLLLCPHAAPDLTTEPGSASPDRSAGSDTLAPCGECSSCKLLDDPDAAHPDLHLIYKELALYSSDAATRARKLLNIPVEVLRTHLVEPVNRKAQLNDTKVFIIDEAERIDPTGQNTLLKTLEEPAPGTFIFLITTQPQRLLPTIHSRCQHIAFNLLPHHAVTHYLKENHPDLDPTRADLIARFARGSLGSADLAVEFELDQWLTTLQPLVNTITAGRPAPQLGPTLADLAETYAKAHVDKHKNASKDAANKSAVRLLLALLAHLCTEQLTAHAPDLDPADPESAEQILAPYLKGIDLVQQADRHLASNVSPALLLDNLAIQWSS